MPCELGEALGDESWVQWREWTPSEGRHRIQVRATDGDGMSGEPVDRGAEGSTITTVDA